jgi:hypothetical protein
VKRSRGRGRRPQNNHNRAFDSTGPDVKIRGTAAHVYEKYLQLARDAGSQGDRVMAENYLQHAEHYYRILMAQGPQAQAGQPGFGGGGQQQQPVAVTAMAGRMWAAANSRPIPSRWEARLRSAWPMPRMSWKRATKPPDSWRFRLVLTEIKAT